MVGSTIPNESGSNWELPPSTFLIMIEWAIPTCQHVNCLKIQIYGWNIPGTQLQVISRILGFPSMENY
jgi:hypothetical protein